MSLTQSFLFLSWLMNLLILLSLLFHAFLTCSLAPLCHRDDRSALLQFKDSFVIDCHASSDDPLAYAKVQSWKLHHDCCLWEGVRCDDRTGHVMGLDLSSSCLYGSINSSSSLFNLVHLRILNLANNDFNYSKIPSELGHLSKLIYLNFSASSFLGDVPSNISLLSNLSTLDLNLNDKLVLKNPDFGSLLQNLTNLEDLILGKVDISSTVPNLLANISSLKSLLLSGCRLYGEFPISIFHLPRLQTLKLAENPDLIGHLPEFNFSSSLQALMLSYTSFFGELPSSIGNLSSLNMLRISKCGFSGQVPASLGTIPDLAQLGIGLNNFMVKNSSSLSWVGKLTKLKYLDLSGININNEIPTYLANLTQLTVFILEQCQLNGQIPSWLVKMTQLGALSFEFNQLQGPISDSIFKLTNLEYLNVFGNNLSGTVELAMFLNKLEKLTELRLSANRLSLIDNVDSNATVGKFLTLGLGSCNLTHFPSFLRDQDELQWLDLSGNYINDKIPKWLWNASKDTLMVVQLSHNFLTGFEQDPAVFPWTQATSFDISHNMWQGSLHEPPPSIEIYLVSHNNLTGEISPVFCSLSALSVLDMSHNSFSGTLPQCLGNLSTSLQVLNLEGNNFHGNVPSSYNRACNLRMFNLDSNKLVGELPTSLANCTKLEYLIIGNNHIVDLFPSWLAVLAELKVLILRSNKFHGVLGNHMTNFDFRKLLIIDISNNNFSGKLPTQCFRNWNAMKRVGSDQLKYLEGQEITYLYQSYSRVILDIAYSISMINKGNQLRYPKILESFMAIDFSSNKFEGDIPQAIGELHGLRVLNLSNNNFHGGIPASLSNLTLLESLDLSRNNLTGKIAQQLLQLGFLAVFNVSSNHLEGPIPQGKQFATFQNGSYLNNSGLCGIPLSKKCENAEALPPSSSNEEDRDLGSFIFQYGWKPVAIGYGSGLIVGAMIGYIVVTKKFEWFLKTFRVRSRRRIERGMMHRP